MTMVTQRPAPGAEAHRRTNRPTSHPPDYLRSALAQSDIRAGKPIAVLLSWMTERLIRWLGQGLAGTGGRPFNELQQRLIHSHRDRLQPGVGGLSAGPAGRGQRDKAIALRQYGIKGGDAVHLQDGARTLRLPGRSPGSTEHDGNARG